MKMKHLNILLCVIISTVVRAETAPKAEEGIPNVNGGPLACWTSDIEIKGSVTLNRDCKVAGIIYIHESNTSLDCNNHTIDLQGVTNHAIVIDSRGQKTSGIRISNCRISNSRQKTIYIGWDANARKKAQSLSINEIYNATPHDITIQNTHIINSGSSAIYIDDYVTNVDLDKLIIRNPASLAIYFEFSSKNNQLRNSTIEGAGNNGKREAVAIDSSSGNILYNNTFIDNKYGAIFVYRNCSEHYNSDPTQAFRWMSADNNRIEHNRINGSRYGIWIASRQSTDLKNSGCGLPYYAEGRYVIDSAKNNKVLGNEISAADIGILVEDDKNTISDNKFTNIKVIPIRIGSKVLFDYVGRGIHGTITSQNRWLDSDKNPVAWMWGSSSTLEKQSDVRN